MKKNLILWALAVLVGAGTMQAREAGADALRMKKEVNREDTIHASAVDALKHSYFVLQADEVINRNGVEAEAEALTNFVAVRGPIAIVQLAKSIDGTPCGVTMEGRIGQMKIEEDRKGNTVCTFNIDSPMRTMTLRITLSKKSNEAMAEISSCKHVKGIALNGRLLYGADARILIGEPS